MILSEPGPIPQAPVGQFCRHNLSPRGDGNSLGLSYGTSLKHRHNLSPRGDGNRSAVRGRSLYYDTTYPREGTETCAASDNPTRTYDTTYPREGTETNGVMQKSLWQRTQLIPARGRKRRSRRSHRLRWQDTTYPREGTETYFCFALLSLLSNLTQLIPARGRKRFDLLFFRHLYPTQLIPARGRKRLRRIGRSSRVPDTTYPREGTETPTPPQSRQSGRTQLIPARGRKRCGASGGQAVCRDTTYPREGTET